jgi:hypothetical protein
MLHAIWCTSGPRSFVTLRVVGRQLATDDSEKHRSVKQGKNEPWNAWSQNTGPICYPATSVTNYQPTSCNITEERRRRLHRDGSPRSRNTLGFHFVICEHMLLCCVEYRISFVVALNLGPFTIVASNGLVVWGSSCRGFAGTLLSLPYTIKVARGIRSILWNKLKYLNDCNTRLYWYALFLPLGLWLVSTWLYMVTSSAM